MPSDIFFTQDPTQWSLLEGAYVSERDPPGFVEGRDMSVVGFSGKTCRGPSSPQTMTSFARFVEVYGGKSIVPGSGLIDNEVWRALIGKPWGPFVVRRVVAADAVLGTLNLIDSPTTIVRVDASSKGSWSEQVTVAVEDATDEEATHFNLRIAFQGKEILLENLSCDGDDDNLAETLGDDIANWVVLTKINSGRPDNVAATALASGADGTLVNGDYTSGITELAGVDGVSVCLIPEAPPTPATLNGVLVTLAAAASDRIFLTWSGVHGQSRATEVTAVGAQITTRSDRIVWCYNSAKVLDPETSLKIPVGPHTFLASIMANHDVSVHVGSNRTAKQNAAIRELYNQGLSRDDLKLLRAAGICTLEKLEGKFLFRSGVTTLLTTAKKEIARRRQADWLILSAITRLREYVKEVGTDEVLAALHAEVKIFSQELKDKRFVVKDFYVDQKSVNTDAQRARGEEHLLWRVKTFAHILFFVLEPEIGTGVTITEQGAAA